MDYPFLVGVLGEPAGPDEPSYRQSRRRRGRRRRGKEGTDLMTLQQYQETLENALPQELIFGRMRVADAPFVPHQRVVFAVARAWQRQAVAGSPGEVFIAPTDVILDAERGLVVQPDALFVSCEREAIVHERIYGAPDLVLEVLSPRPRIGDIDERIRWFATYGDSAARVHHAASRFRRPI